MALLCSGKMAQLVKAVGTITFLLIEEVDEFANIIDTITLLQRDLKLFQHNMYAVLSLY